MRSAILLALAVAVLASGPAPAQVSRQATAGAVSREALMVRRDADDKRRIVRGEIAAGTESTLYRTSKDVIYEIAVSPDNRHTAAIESIDGTVENGEYVVPPKDTLVILNAAGEVVRSVEDVQHYIFSPDGRSVAYVVGGYYEGGVGFLPRGAWVMEIDSGETRQIEAEGVYELHWVQSGDRDHVYLRTLAPAPERRVLRYEVRTRTVAPVASGAFHHSPDGRYYLSRPYELIERGRCDRQRLAAGRCFGLFDSRSGQPAASLPDPELGEPVGWAFAEGHKLLLSQTEADRETATLMLGASRFAIERRTRTRAARSTIWDVGEGRVLETLEGASSLSRRTHGWTTGRGELLLRPAAEDEAEVPARRVVLRRDPPGAR